MAPLESYVGPRTFPTSPRVSFWLDEQSRWVSYVNVRLSRVVARSVSVMVVSSCESAAKYSDRWGMVMRIGESCDIWQSQLSCPKLTRRPKAWQALTNQVVPCHFDFGVCSLLLSEEFQDMPERVPYYIRLIQLFHDLSRPAWPEVALNQGDQTRTRSTYPARTALPGLQEQHRTSVSC